MRVYWHNFIEEQVPMLHLETFSQSRASSTSFVALMEVQFSRAAKT